VLYDSEFQCRWGPRLFRFVGLYLDSTLLKATHHEELATQTIETLKQEERLGKDAVIVYAEKYLPSSTR